MKILKTIPAVLLVLSQLLAPSSFAQQAKSLTMQQLLAKMVSNDPSNSSTVVVPENDVEVTMPLSAIVNALIASQNPDFGPQDLLRELSGSGNSFEAPFLDFQQDEGGWSGGGGFECENAEIILKVASQQLSQAIRRMSPEIFKSMPVLTQMQLADVIENVRFHPDKRVRREGKSLKMNYGRDEKGYYLEALNPFCTAYSGNAIKFTKPKKDELNSPELDDVILQLAHEAGHILGIREENGDRFGFSLMRAMLFNWKHCSLENPADYEKVAWLGWRQYALQNPIGLLSTQRTADAFQSARPVERKFEILFDQISGRYTSVFGTHRLVGISYASSPQNENYFNYLTDLESRIAFLEEGLETSKNDFTDAKFVSHHTLYPFFTPQFDVQTNKGNLNYVVKQEIKNFCDPYFGSRCADYTDSNLSMYNKYGSLVESVTMDPLNPRITYSYKLNNEPRVDVTMICETLYPELEIILN